MKKHPPPPQNEFKSGQDEDEVTEVSTPEAAQELEAAGDPVAELTEKIAALEKERDDFKDKYIRTYADLENYRKRVIREKEEMLKFSNEKLLKEILFIKDNLDRALEHQEAADLKTLQEGLDLINREFSKLMAQVNVEEIDALGKPFDPNFHEAIGQEESDQPEGTVIAQLQTGYMFHDRLLRPARVIVAK